MNSITEAGRETATERDKLSADSLARARAAILHLGAASFRMELMTATHLERPSINWL